MPFMEEMNVVIDLSLDMGFAYEHQREICCYGSFSRGISVGRPRRLLDSLTDIISGQLQPQPQEWQSI